MYRIIPILDNSFDYILKVFSISLDKLKSLAIFIPVWKVLVRRNEKLHLPKHMFAPAALMDPVGST